jgi:hypothetical protein
MFDGISDSELLSVAVFAGLSGRTDLLGRFLVYLLTSGFHTALTALQAALPKG